MKLLALLAISGCALATAPEVPRHTFRGIAVRVEPPRPMWLAGYAGAELCSGIRGDVRRIRWHIVPGTSFLLGGRALVGYADGRDVYLSEWAASRVWVARHEALHTLGVQHEDTLTMVHRCRAMPPYATDDL